MLNTLGVILAGAFIGAIGMEVVNRKYPDAMNKVHIKAKEMTSELKVAFKNGYDNSMRSKATVA